MQKRSLWALVYIKFRSTKYPLERLRLNIILLKINQGQNWGWSIEHLKNEVNLLKTKIYFFFQNGCKRNNFFFLLFCSPCIHSQVSRRNCKCTVVVPPFDFLWRCVNYPLLKSEPDGLIDVRFFTIVEPRYNEGARDWRNVLSETRFRSI